MNPVSANENSAGLPHVPVMLGEVIDSLAPRDGGIYVDGTFGAGGYTRAILGKARCQVFAIDRDPEAIAAGAAMVRDFDGRLTLIHGRFAEMKRLLADAGVSEVDGIVLDIGVSSMQLDDAGRGFSFMRDGPLDMRMSRSGESAADVVGSYSAEDLANIIYQLGEEAKSRSIARSIVAARSEAPIETTLQLVKAIERATGPQRAQMKTHPATRTFQALRIYVNNELGQLAQGLAAAEELLKEGGRLVVVTFHSLEDRIVKRFMAERSGHVPQQSRHAPGLQELPEPSFALPFKGHVDPSDEETQRNPRARSAKLRAGVRTAAAAHKLDLAQLGIPGLKERRH